MLKRRLTPVAIERYLRERILELGYGRGGDVAFMLDDLSIELGVKGKPSRMAQVLRNVWRSTDIAMDYQLEFVRHGRGLKEVRFRPYDE